MYNKHFPITVLNTLIYCINTIIDYNYCTIGKCVIYHFIFKISIREIFFKNKLTILNFFKKACFAVRSFKQCLH